MATKKQIPDIEEQWERWQVENEPERFEHIDTEQLKQDLIAEDRKSTRLNSSH